VTNDQKDSMFTLLYALVLIDKRVLKVETDKFFSLLEAYLIRIESIDYLQAKAQISNWFVPNYKKVLSEMKSPSRDHYLREHIENLKDVEERQDIFDMMNIIAIADNEFHAAEKQFLEKIALIWNVGAAS